MIARANRPAHERLSDILRAVERTKQAEDQLLRSETNGDDEATRIALDAILYNLVVIGEAVNALPTDVTEAEPGVPWRDIVDMRNFLSHEYFRVLTDVVRQTVDEPLEQLRQACSRLVAAHVDSAEQPHEETRAASDADDGHQPLDHHSSQRSDINGS